MDATTRMIREDMTVFEHDAEFWRDVVIIQQACVDQFQNPEAYVVDITPFLVLYQDASERCRARHQRRMIEQADELRRWRGEMMMLRERDEAEALLPAAPIGELQQFAQDRQNVHTKQMVEKTHEVIKRVTTIKVDAGYTWSRTTMSKTPGEIIASCTLPVPAAIQMMTYYSSQESIYGAGEAIYGKVLDSVWQYIKNSPDRTDLCKILRSELTDNIGMCAQGNLTRLCNVLAGYLDGVGETSESPNEIVQRKLPKLMEIEDENERIQAAKKILTDAGMPTNQWNDWLEPLYA